MIFCLAVRTLGGGPGLNNFEARFACVDFIEICVEWADIVIVDSGSQPALR